jgi:ketosteroid isomerase-like protein
MHPFRAAIEAGDVAAAVALCSDDVEFRSPVAFAPYRGRAALTVILGAVIEVFQDRRYVSEISSETDHVLVFRARVGERDLEGADFLHYAADGAIDEFTVMVRPLSAAQALAEEMGAKLAAGGGLRPGVAPSPH